MISAHQRFGNVSKRLTQQGRGVSLGSAAIEDFIRMILSAIPSPSLQKIAADVVVEVDRDRQLTGIHLNPSN